MCIRDRPVIEEAMVNDAGAASVGEELRAVAEQSASRDLVQQSHHFLTRILHLQHRRSARPELLDHDAEVFLRHIDGQRFVGLESLALRTFTRDHSRTRYLKLVTLAPHRLHQDGETVSYTHLR